MNLNTDALATEATELQGLCSGKLSLGETESSHRNFSTRRMNMKSQRIFSLIGLTALMIISAGLAHGQAGRASDVKRGIFNQVHTGARKPQADGAKTQSEQSQKPGNYPKKNALLGTWDVVLTFNDGSQVKSTLQIMPGPA